MTFCLVPGAVCSRPALVGVTRRPCGHRAGAVIRLPGAQRVTDVGSIRAV